ncbi:hypothetical protein BLX87_00230 [Bacillus sp. VT-16-64]|nr:hypothetical protein BLX87_00230 [Bacillus sp. VT-16-64]
MAPYMRDKSPSRLLNIRVTAAFGGSFSNIMTPCIYSRSKNSSVFNGNEQLNTLKFDTLKVFFLFQNSSNGHFH